MRCRHALVLVAFLVVPLRAGQQQDDFARGFTAEPNEDRPFFELSVPEEVYRTVTRPDLGDLRVFNREGSIVPHAVRRPSARLEDGPPPRLLPFFPLRGQVEDAGATPTLRIMTDERGVIIGATPEATLEGENQRVTAYIVDLSEVPDAPNLLEFDWESTSDDGFAVTVNVESSDDLARWRPVATAVTLAELRSDGGLLARKSVELPEFAGKYLRIGWPDPLRAVRLTGVRASFPAQAQRLPRETLLVPGTPAADSSGAVVFDTGGVRPVDRIRVMFEERNAVAEVALLSKPTREAEWRQRVVGRFYTLDRMGTLVQSPPVEVERTTDRYWRAEIGGQAGAVRPAGLEIGWIPDLLTVVAQGDGPFTVTFGSATVEAADHPTEAVLRDISDDERLALISSARVSSVSTLGGESRLQPPLPWRIWLLWGVLTSGVGLLAWMVRQLMTRPD
jgi:hypothetical protein